MREKNECVTRQLEARNKCLEDRCNRLEDNLAKEKNDVVCLQRQNETLERSLERISDELCDTTEMLNETNGALEKKTKEHCELRFKLEILNDRLSWTIEKCDIEKLKVARDIGLMSVELELEKQRNAELNATVREQSDRLRSQAEMLVELNRENEGLKGMIATERVQADDWLNESRREKLQEVNGRKESEKRLEECLKGSQCAVLENERLKSEINELRYRLDAVVKNDGEKQNTLAERICRMDERIKGLNVEMNSKSRIINAELEEQVLASEQMCNAQTENVKNLEWKLRNLRQRPNVQSSSSVAISRSNSTTFVQSYATVLDELKSIDENSYSSDDYIYTII